MKRSNEDRYISTQKNYAVNLWGKIGFPSRVEARIGLSSDRQEFLHGRKNKVALFCIYNDGNVNIKVQVPHTAYPSKVRQTIARVVQQELVDVTAYVDENEIVFETGEGKSLFRKI